MIARQGLWALGGGIASGKSQVRDLLDGHGVATVDSDSHGHRVLEPDGPAFDAVAGRWPEVVSDGRVDRAALASIVFSDADELSVLESMTHPHIIDTIEAEVERFPGPVVVELPILSMAKAGRWRLLVVDANDEVRLERAIGRGMDEADVVSRMASQPKRAEWLAVADMVIPNHGGLDELAITVGRVAPLL